MITIDNEICNGCGLCARDCFTKLIEIKDKTAVITHCDCLSCGHCAAVCPREAITVNKYDMSETLVYNPQVMQVDQDQLFGFMQYRRSTRQFKGIPVEKEKLEKIIEAGRYSPTTANNQTVRYIVLQDQLEDARKLAVDALYKMAVEFPDDPYHDTNMRIYEAAKQNKDFLFHHAPAVIAVLGHKANNNINAALAASRMELMANALGLGACFIGLFTRAVNNETELSEMLGIDRHYSMTAALAIGYPAVNYLRTVPRKKAKVEWK
ncbi:MAG: nitroreductase family protein [Thermincola sp.]|jgi:nitroreductase/Pyruvate/2-oxoacid:ferredoxin oxidoreductase delta subunit|nr:nitroreductase family protein [Thermincola sp.]